MHKPFNYNLSLKIKIISVKHSPNQQRQTTKMILHLPNEKHLYLYEKFCSVIGSYAKVLCMQKIPSLDFENNNNSIITLKGTIPGFLQSPHCATNCLQHVR